MINVKRYRDTPYLVYDNGEVFTELRHRFLIKTLDGRGYYKVKLNFCANKVVHRLVAEVYLENPNNLPQVNHIDGNKLNNHVSNLEWCSGSDNIKHAYRTGLLCTLGEKNSCALLKEDQVLQIRYLREYKNFKIKELANKFNVSESAIKGVIYRSNWKHI